MRGTHFTRMRFIVLADRDDLLTDEGGSKTQTHIHTNALDKVAARTQCTGWRHGASSSDAKAVEAHAPDAQELLSAHSLQLRYAAATHTKCERSLSHSSGMSLQWKRVSLIPVLSRLAKRQMAFEMGAFGR